MFRLSALLERVWDLLLGLVCWQTLSVFQLYNVCDKGVQDWWNGMDSEGSGHGPSRGTAQKFTRIRFRKPQTPRHERDVAVLLTVQLSLFISVINQLDAQHFCFTITLFHASTCFEHVLIIRRSKLHYTASGIIKPIGVMIPEAV